MLFSAELSAQVATRLLRDLDAGMRTAVAKDSKSIGDELVRWIRTTPGPAPYQKVYAKLGQSARVRTRAGRPPEVVVGGAKRFSGGATVQQLARPYEYGAKTGDHRRGSTTKPSRTRRRSRRPLPQFPPASNEGLWVNKICEDHGEDVVTAWLGIVNDMLDELARRDHG